VTTEGVLTEDGEENAAFVPSGLDGGAEGSWEGIDGDVAKHFKTFGLDMASDVVLVDPTLDDNLPCALS
jgi:hypothetical protein